MGVGFAGFNRLYSNIGSHILPQTPETKDGETSRVALYMNEEEAKLGLKTRQEIANDKGLSYTYELHQISKDNL